MSEVIVASYSAEVISLSPSGKSLGWFWVLDRNNVGGKSKKVFGVSSPAYFRVETMRAKSTVYADWAKFLTREMKPLDQRWMEEENLRPIAALELAQRKILRVAEFVGSDPKNSSRGFHTTVRRREFFHGMKWFLMKKTTAKIAATRISILWMLKSSLLFLLIVIAAKLSIPDLGLEAVFILTVGVDVNSNRFHSYIVSGQNSRARATKAAKSSIAARAKGFENILVKTDRRLVVMVSGGVLDSPNCENVRASALVCGDFRCAFSCIPEIFAIVCEVILRIPAPTAQGVPYSREVWEAKACLL